MRILIDTNIILDIYLKREPLCSSSTAFLRYAKSVNDELYISSSTFKDAAYFLKKIFHDDKIVNKKLCKLYGSINKIVGLTSDDAITAIYQDGDYEDNMLANSANRAMCDMIVTRNVKHFRENAINTFTPEEYLQFRK